MIRQLGRTFSNQVLKHATLLCNRAAAHLRCPGADAASSCAEDAEAAAIRTDKQQQQQQQQQQQVQ